MATIRQLITQLIFTTNTSGINQANSALNGFKRNAGSAGNAANNMANSIANGAGRANSAIGSVSDGVGGLLGKLNALAGAMAAAFSVDKIVSTADEVMNLDGRLRTVTKTDEERYGLEDKLYEMAQNNRQEYSAIGDLFYKVQRGASRYGFSSDDSMRVADIVSKSLTVGGASTQEAQATILQLGQALSSGVLQGDELHSLDENASLLMQHVAENLGVTIGELKKMGSEGKLTSEVVMQAILASGNAVDSEFSKMPMTIGQSMTVVENLFTHTVDKIQRESKVFSSISEFIINNAMYLSQQVEAFFQVLDGDEDAIANHPGLARFAERLQWLVGQIQWAKQQISNLFTGMSFDPIQIGDMAGTVATVMTILSAVRLIATAGSILGGVFGPLLSIFGTLGGLLMSFGSGLITMFGSIGGFLGTISSIWGVISGGIAAVGAALGPLIIAFVVLGSVIYVLYTYWDQVVAYFQPGIEAIRQGVDSLQQAWIALQPVIAALMPILQLIATVVGVVIVGAIVTLWNIATAAFEAIAAVIGLVADALSGLVGLIQTIIGGLQNLLGLAGQASSVNLDAMGNMGLMSPSQVYNQTNTFNGSFSESDYKLASGYNEQFFSYS